MRAITRARALIVAGALVGTATLGAVAASGDTGESSTQRKAVPTTRATAADTRAPQGGARTERRTETERGLVLEGTGTWRGQEVTVSVYENQRYGNALQIIVGDPDGEHAIGAGEGRDAYVIDGVLNVGLAVGGDLAVVKGAVSKSGAPRPTLERDADGELVSSRGTRVPLLVVATFTYRGETVDLTFPRAFRYHLESERVAAR